MGIPKNKQLKTLKWVFWLGVLLPISQAQYGGSDFALLIGAVLLVVAFVSQIDRFKKYRREKGYYYSFSFISMIITIPVLLYYIFIACSVIYVAVEYPAFDRMDAKCNERCFEYADEGDDFYYSIIPGEREIEFRTWNCTCFSSSKDVIDNFIYKSYS